MISITVAMDSDRRLYLGRNDDDLLEVGVCTATQIEEWQDWMSGASQIIQDLEDGRADEMDVPSPLELADLPLERNPLPAESQIGHDGRLVDFQDTYCDSSSVSDLEIYDPDQMEVYDNDEPTDQQIAELERLGY